MARYELFTSIDVGSRSIKAAVIGRKGDGLDLLAYAITPSRGIEAGDIKDVVAFKESLGAVLDELERQFMRVYDSEFLVSFSSDRFELKDINEEMNLSESEEVLITEDMIEDFKAELLEKLSGPSSGKVIFNMYPRRYLLNGERVVFSPIDMRAKSLIMEMVVVMTDYSMSEALRGTITDTVDSEPEMMASPISASEGVLTSTEKDSGVMVVELGHNFTTVIAYLNSSPVYMTIVPLGIKNVIKDIASVFGTSFEEAERLLRTHGNAMYDIREEDNPEIEYRGLDGRTVKLTTRQRLASVIHARLREIMNKVRRIYKDLELRVKEFRDRGIPGGVVLTGGGAKVSRITDLAAGVFRTSVRIGSYSTSTPMGNPSIMGDTEALDDPTFSAVFGNLAVYLRNLSSPMEFSSKPRRSSGGVLKKLAEFFKNMF